MADDKSGRDKQARDEDKRQRQRDMRTEVARGDEVEPPVENPTLSELESELEALEFPATGTEIVEAIGDREIPAPTETYTVGDLIPETDDETFDAPGAVRVQVQRPTVASAMKRVLEAAAEVPHVNLTGSQRKAYERTFLALRVIDPDDDDEGIGAIADWTVERIHEKSTLPSSRAVRRQAAKFCRQNGYEIRNDEWLGI